MRCLRRLGPRDPCREVHRRRHLHLAATEASSGTPRPDPGHADDQEAPTTGGVLKELVHGSFLHLRVPASQDPSMATRRRMGGGSGTRGAEDAFEPARGGRRASLRPPATVPSPAAVPPVRRGKG
jgi:hypothetical protein